MQIQSVRQYRTSERGVPDACQFPYVPDETPSDCVNACDPACVPIRNEPFMIMLLVAWGAAKPVIATDAVHLIDNFSNGVTGYGNPESITWRIKYSMGDLDLAKEMGRNGKKLVETKYNWDRIADDTAKVYLRLEGQFPEDNRFNSCRSSCSHHLRLLFSKITSDSI